jgi:hypothetical protein
VGAAGCGCGSWAPPGVDGGSRSREWGFCVRRSRTPVWRKAGGSWQCIGIGLGNTGSREHRAHLGNAMRRGGGGGGGGSPNTHIFKTKRHMAPVVRGCGVFAAAERLRPRRPASLAPRRSPLGTGHRADGCVCDMPLPPPFPSLPISPSLSPSVLSALLPHSALTQRPGLEDNSIFSSISNAQNSLSLGKTVYTLPGARAPAPI